MADNANVVAADQRPQPIAGRYVTAIIFLVFLAELAIWAQVGSEWLDQLQALALHGAVVATSGLLLWRPIASGMDGGTALVSLLATCVAGPFGAACSLLLPRLVARSTESSSRLELWYERIALSSKQDEFTRLSDRVSIGRAANLAAPIPKSFDELFQSRDLAAQQAALGMIARSFHPRFLHVLKIALRSSEPLIRVQAAAVAARIRAALNRQTASLIDQAANPAISHGSAIAISSELDATISSGLLDEKMRIDAARTNQALLSRTFAQLDNSANLSASVPAPESVGADYELYGAYADHLLKQSRFHEFRQMRLAYRRRMSGRYRHRIVRARALPLSIKLAPISVRD